MSGMLYSLEDIVISPHIKFQHMIIAYNNKCSNSYCVIQSKPYKYAIKSYMQTARMPLQNAIWPL